MTINGEPVELVTDFGALRVGDVVYVKPCHCGAAHRMVLLRLHVAAVVYNLRGGASGPVECWESLPATHGISRQVVTSYAVEARALFRVVNPPLASDDAEENRGLDRQRLRRVLSR